MDPLDARRVGPLGDRPAGAPNVRERSDDPPPYESVVIEGASAATAGAAGSPHVSGRYGIPARSDFQITVTDPMKHGDGVGAYVSYKVTTSAMHPNYRREQTEVIRRFRDFAWLQQRLRNGNRGIIVPAMPQKNVLEKYKMNTEFIEQRRAALEVFLNRVAAHPSLQHSPDLLLFLEASEAEFGIEVSRADLVGSSGGPGATAAKATFSGALRLFRTWGHSASSLYHKTSGEGEEDPQYLKLRAYVMELEQQAAEVDHQAARLARHRAALGTAVQEFGAAIRSLGRQEQSDVVSDLFDRLGEKVDAVSRICLEASEHLHRSFEAPIRELVRMSRSAGKVMADRSTALVAYHQARADVDAHRARLAKVRGTPGIREEKVAEAERDLNGAQLKAGDAKSTYELISGRMTDEVARFQHEHAQEMAYVLRDFAVMQAHLSADSARIWRSLVPSLSQADAQ